MAADTTDIFDAHVHIWSDDRAAYPMVSGLERPEDEKGSADWLISLMDKAEVSGALLVQTPWYGEDNQYLVESMRRLPGRFAALGYLNDPIAPDAPDRLERQYHEDGFRGVRLHLIEERVATGLEYGEADPLLQCARKLSIPVQFLNRMHHMPLIEATARRFSDISFVVDHMGHPDISEGPPYPSSRRLFGLAACPNVYVKVSLHHQHSPEKYPWRDLHDFQARLLEAFEPRRLMWGSNFPMSMPDPSYRQRLEAVSVELDFLSPDEHDWILAGTARSLWPID